LRALIEAFTQEKRDWLALLLQPGMLRYVATPRTLRDDFVELGYCSGYGLQARHWKLALDDAAALLHRHLCAVLKEVRRAIARHPAYGEAERHYAYWLVADYDRLGAVLLGGAPCVASPQAKADRELKSSAGPALAANPKATLDRAGRRRVAAYVHRQFRSLQGHWPRIRLSRSMLFDANCYSVGRTRSAGTQVLLLMGQEPRQRIALPLKGETRISGTIRVVMDGDAIEVHAGAEVHRFQDPIPGTIQAIDLGYTEVMTDSGGHRYGQGFGAKLTACSDQIHDAGQRRGKLRAGMYKARSRKDPKSKAKARHIKKNNLGRTKANRNKARREATLERDVNAAINQLLRQRRPEVLVSEDLRHAFPGNGSPAWNRRLSSWVRGLIQDRLAFKVPAGGSRGETVNPAYGSQTCPKCGCWGGSIADWKRRDRRKPEPLRLFRAGLQMPVEVRPPPRRTMRETPARRRQTPRSRGGRLRPPRPDGHSECETI